jgi:release factor glutamine methyltransferase
MQTIKPTHVNASHLHEAANIEHARREAYILHSHAINKDMTYIISHENYMMEENHGALYDLYIRQKCEKMPTAYITGTKEFMSLDFFVDEHVLIPRPETEILAEEAIALLSERDKPEVLDLCCGSGCVGISVAEYVPQCRVTFSDVSKNALDVARRNAAAHLAKKRAAFAVSDMFASLPARRYDLIVSNPPYISESEYETLGEEIVRYEPKEALDGGPDGLKYYRMIAENAARYMNEDAWLLLEIGCGQAKDVVKLLKQHKFSAVTVKQDLSGRDRIVIAKGGAKK